MWSWSNPRAFSATSEDAPKSTTTVALAVSSQKQVLNRPPEPKASPQPMTVSRMSGARARPRRHLGVPPSHMDAGLGHREAGGLHEIDGDKSGDVGDGKAIAGNEGALFQFTVKNGQEFGD